MDAKERYFWDIQGHLIVRNVLSPKELEALNNALDYVIESGAINQSEENRGAADSSFLRGAGARWAHGTNLLNLPKPHCEPVRQLLAHPQIVSRLNVMCGKGFRLDHGPQFNNAVKGTAGLTLHGSGDPHKDYVAYHHQNGIMHVGGVTVTWNLTDCPENKGGFACVPGSHKSKFPMPKEVRNCDADMGTVINPEIRAGDILFFMDGAQTHGTHPWQNDHDRRSILFKYASRTAIRQSREISAPDIYWDENIIDGMTTEQRAVMFGPCSAPPTKDMNLTVEEDGTVSLTNRQEQQSAD
jgi:ectoine hydroxylase-related dioxygenase (phytanoyl-CoA dioxygenase family)